jgi:hypothetical protein
MINRDGLPDTWSRNTLLFAQYDPILTGKSQNVDTQRGPMYKKTNMLMLTMAALALFLIAGCSEDETPTTPPDAQTYQLDILDLEALVAQVAPPEYVAPSAAPNEIDSIWMYGQSPLLEKVFGSQDPQTLYANINSFKMSMDIITSTVLADENNNLITGVYVDSHLVDGWDGQVMLHFTATVTALADSTIIPAGAQEVLGTGFDLDYLISVETVEQPNAIVKIGMTVNDTEQTLMQFDEGSGDPTDTESRLIYASLNPVDSTFVFKGVGFCEHQDGQMYNYAFNITSEANSDFAYRVTWYSNGSVENDLINCVLGGGNKDTEFALSYRMFMPADTTVCDSNSIREQVFGPDYTEGTGLVTDYATYVDEDLLFLYDAVPQAMVPNPWAE